MKKDLVQSPRSFFVFEASAAGVAVEISRRLGAFGTGLGELRSLTSFGMTIGALGMTIGEFGMTIGGLGMTIGGLGMTINDR